MAVPARPASYQLSAFKRIASKPVEVHYNVIIFTLVMKVLATISPTFYLFPQACGGS
ncbi:hypothetical protein SAMN04487941_2618 [Pontibacter akesuensis]|uniref:Uncharacterized protein n=1 Tax=Pontibacter akesuensis TaxID=388950 RepID=A0A1I7J9M9_9BACT|nr:hypothetical protein SAMN04487941_2618 [Pontibacter akesuensis]